MSWKNRKLQASPASTAQAVPLKGRFRGHLLAFALGAVLTGGAFLIYFKAEETKSTLGRPSATSDDVGHRTVAQLMALSDAELEKVDVLEMSVAVAREIPGLEKLDYNHYRQIVDGWTDQFRRWLPTVEYAFHEKPDKYKNDINFFRLGLLAQFLDEQIGVAYVEEQKQAQLAARKSGKKTEVLYTNPGDLLVHGLIDTKQGTCGTMPTLHVIIGRRMGWPVALACVESHYVCHYDDGKVHYNIEATDTGRGGFGEGSDEDYMQKEGVSRKAIACGSDLRRLSAREMLGVFVALRARHYADTNRPDLADRSYALSRVLFPTHRQAYIESVPPFLWRGESLFEAAEQGHPNSLAHHLVARQGLLRTDSSDFEPPPVRRPDPMAEWERINAINRANRDRLM